MSVSLVVLSVAFVGLSSLIYLNERSHRLQSAEVVVNHVLRSVAERIRANNYDDIAAAYDGFTFEVAEISGTGTVTVLTDETANSEQAQFLGLPRDLDGDGSATNTDVSGDYMLLPVRIDVTWADETRTLAFLLAEE